MQPRDTFWNRWTCMAGLWMWKWYLGFGGFEAWAVRSMSAHRSVPWIWGPQGNWGVSSHDSAGLVLDAAWERDAQNDVRGREATPNNEFPPLLSFDEFCTTLFDPLLPKIVYQMVPGITRFYSELKVAGTLDSISQEMMGTRWSLKFLADIHGYPKVCYFNFRWYTMVKSKNHQIYPDISRYG